MQTRHTHQWDGKINFRSYSEVEDCANYPNQRALEQYRSERLAKYKGYVDFFVKRGVPSGGLRVVEVGSGSSALLYAMEEKAILAQGIGIELSKSRHQFAERWKHDRKSRYVKNVHADFSHVDLPSHTFDYYLVLDNTFSYLYPEDATYPGRLLEQAHACLHAKGSVVLAMNNYIPVIADMVRDEVKFWHELPESNAFRYALYHLRFNRKKNILRTEGIYIAQDGTKKEKIEIAYVYSADTLFRLLRKYRFRIQHRWSDFTGKKFVEKQSQQLVLIAEKV